MEELRRIAESDARFLRAREIKAMLVACGTVSSNCLGEVEATAGVPVIGVVKPAAAEAAAATKNGKIGVLSTVATMRSGAFVRELLRLSPELEVTSSGSPLLVPLVEAGRADPEDAEVASAVEELSLIHIYARLWDAAVSALEQCSAVLGDVELDLSLIHISCGAISRSSGLCRRP